MIDAQIAALLWELELAEARRREADWDAAQRREWDHSCEEEEANAPEARTGARAGAEGNRT